MGLASSELILGAQLVVSFFAGVVGVALWAHTREPSWVFVVLGILFQYISLMLDLLDRLGVIQLNAWLWQGIPWLRLTFAVLPMLLVAVGLIFALRSYFKP
ncbi:MAG: hypothetical protein HKM05_06060 [Spirochaetales bacterium]|nr:hypothetical protein [Spirochaetales bacterium]